ncbi:Ger(x)C family spore germination protein [Paenibacillus sp. P25]|nr:Ger(x)C family spore germination protein [Paenibacillus sp. P25]
MKLGWIGWIVPSLLAPLLSGRWDRTEINDLAYVLTSAIDVEQDGQIRYSVLVPLPGQMGGPSGGGGGTSGGNKSYYIDSETGKTAREAQAKLQKRMSRRMFLAHRRTILIGEDFAQKGIRAVFDSASRSPESRMTTYLIITRGKAYDMLKSTPKFERFPSEAIRELAKTKELVEMNMKDVALELSTPGVDAIVPYMGVTPSQKSDKTSQEVEQLGYAQLKGERMVGVIEDRAANGLAWLVGDNPGVTANISLGEHQTVTVRFFDSQTRIVTRLAADRPRYDITVELSAKVLENTGYSDLSQTGVIRDLEHQMNNYVKGCIEEMISQMRKSKTDSVQLGTYLWRAYPGIWKTRYLPDWPKGLMNAEFHIEVRSRLSETGLIYENVTKAENDL